MKVRDNALPTFSEHARGYVCLTDSLRGEFCVKEPLKQSTLSHELIRLNLAHRPGARR